MIGDQSEACFKRPRDVARRRGDAFEALMESVKHCSFGQIADAPHRDGGEDGEVQHVHETRASGSLRQRVSNQLPAVTVLPSIPQVLASHV